MTGEKIPVVRNERNKWAVQKRVDASHARCMEETFGSLPGQTSRLFDRGTRGFSKEDSEESRSDSAHENLLVRLTRRDVFVRLLKEKRKEEKEGSRGKERIK